MEQLCVLDARAQAARPPQLTGRLEGVERLAVRTIADRVDGERPAGLGRAAHDLGELAAARDADARAVEHPGGARAKRAVHERLQVADPEEVVADPGGEAELGELAEPLVRQRLPDP